MKVLSSLLAVASLLVISGCSGPASQVGDSSKAPAAPSGAVPDDVAALLGRVVNQELSPIPGAQVALASASADPTSTNADGVFRFDNIAPGKDVVYVSAIGYQAAAKSVELVAGQRTELSITVQQLAASDPYSALEIQKGFIACGTGAGVDGSGATQVGCGGADPNQKFLFNFTLNKNVSGVLFEMAWRPTQALSRDLSLIVEKNGCDVSCGSKDTFAEIQGCCYLRVELTPDNLSLPAGSLAAVDLREGGVIQTRTFPAFGDASSPITVFTSQDFYLYVETFYNGLPGDFETRSNVPQ